VGNILKQNILIGGDFCATSAAE